MESQFLINGKYLKISIPDYFGEIFIFNNNGYCWLDIEEDTDFPELQSAGAVFKKVKTPEKAFEFIIKNNPERFGSWLMDIKESKFEGVPFYVRPGITKDTAKCTFKNFIYDVIDKSDSGVQIMEKLRVQNPALHEQLLGRGKADLSNFETRPHTLAYAKFHEFIKKNW